MEVVEGRVDASDRDDFLDALDRVGERHGVAVQAFDAELIAGRDHLDAAVEHATRSIERGENVARDPAMELLLYAAGRRQIRQALEIGVGETGGPAVIVVAAGPALAADSGAAGDEAGAASAVRELVASADALDRTDPGRIASFFDVTETERDATDAGLELLVRERVALLDVEK